MPCSFRSIEISASASPPEAHPGVQASGRSYRSWQIPAQDFRPPDRLQLSYVLAFMGQVQIAESLSSTIASTVVGVMLGYFFKALFETFFEKREERFKQESKLEENTNYEEV